MEEGALVIVVVYVFAVPFSAVTTTVIELLPTFNPIAPLACPLTTAVPFTVTIAVASVTVGVTVVDNSEFATVAVYEIVEGEKVSIKLTPDKLIAERSEIEEGADRFILTT